jgi:hypothetical protein
MQSLDGHVSLADTQPHIDQSPRPKQRVVTV